MDWDDLRFFLAIYRAGSTSGAARALGVQHTTVGRRLTGLEEALGTSLFARTAMGLVPTTAADDILAHAQEVERHVQSIGRTVESGDHRFEGVVRLTTSEAFSGYFVRRLSKLHRDHPRLVVEVLSGNRVFDLSRGEADLAVRIAPTPQLDVVCRCIGHANWGLYASEGYIAARGQPSAGFGGHAVIGYDPSLAFTPGAMWLAEHARAAEVPIRANSITSALNAAIVGIGIAAIPCFLADGEPTLRRVTNDTVGQREIWLVFHPDVGRIARVRCVMDFVAAEIAADRATLLGETGSVAAAV
ncbi:MAG TPA: LysR family transcriptional regulator [Hypericibacter adhaerens]|uniref:LysR family transcriptional regulator n=1 Tax=Hypericibacter adhaerens TaxID=2602016 RepID=UPI002CC44B31|nr:LysR family transcriptional regulator [Hypericibacter adhaerens]HWA43973.1 LysR family transcriptional regulator [Hypericibacter adhaerens]